MGTPHINANPGDFAKVVLMPGDPIRAKWIAETYLHDYKEVTNVRGILGFTGYTKTEKDFPSWPLVWECHQSVFIHMNYSPAME